MPRGVFNWTFRDVEKFLKKRGFTYVYTKASHYFYSGFINGKPRLVQVQFHGEVALKPRTLKGIMAQAGIPKEEWLSSGS